MTPILGRSPRTVTGTRPASGPRGEARRVSTATRKSFDEVFRSIADVEGWMTRAQAVRLWDRASVLRPGDRIVEIGSFRGRSAIVLASAAADGVEVITIDPHGGNDRGPQQLEGFEAQGESDHRAYLANLARAGVADRVRHVRLPSQGALGQVEGTVDLLYIDGAHRYVPALADIEGWGDRVADGGTLLIHDSFSSMGVTLALVRALFAGSSFRYVGRAGSMAEYRRVPLRGSERLTNLVRQLAELPWFARNLVVKFLIVVRATPLTRLLGSDGGWPY